MKNDVLHAIDMNSVYTNAIIGIVLGCILTFVPISSLISLISVIIGLVMIVTNGIILYKNFNGGKEKSNEALIAVIGILFGFLLLCFNTKVMIILVAIYLLIEPLLYVIMSKFDKNIMRIELPRIALGVVLLISGVSTLNLVFKIIGIIILVGSLIYLGVNYYFYKKSGVKIIK